MASTSAGDDKAYKGPHKDLIQRGKKGRDVAGTLTFIGLRAADPILQYGILARGIGSSLVHRLGFDTLPPGLAAQTGVKLIDDLGLSSYRLILLGMATGAAAKQIFWLLVICQEELNASAAVQISAFNTVVNSLTSLFFTMTLASASLDSGANFPQHPLLVGSALYVTGILTETFSEIQRHNFKKDPANKDKPCTTGLWGLARHINYTGYILWRSGYAIAGGGWIWGAVMGGLQAYNFVNRAIPVLDDYATKRYGSLWREFQRKTPYKLFPYIY